MRMKRHHEVRHLNVVGHGSTKQEAKADMERRIDRLCEFAADGSSLVETRYGLIVIVSADQDGWSYTIIDPASLPAHGRVIFCNCSYRAEDRLAAISDARNAACQRAWLPSVDDAAHVAASGCNDSHKRDLTDLFAHYRRAAQAA